VATIQVGRKGTFVASADESILDAGLRAGFGFPKACRNGNCERCAGQLLQGRVGLRNGGIVEAAETRQQPVLYCIAHALSDCLIDDRQITAPGEHALITLACQIADITPLNHNVSKVTLRTPAGQNLSWHAGQYLLLGEHQDAAFSIANAAIPGQRDIELHIRHDDDNSSAVALMMELQSQPTIKATLPLGERIIDTAPQQPVWFICGSTGFAPAKAMIERLAQLEFSLPVRLFRGGRRNADLYPAGWQSDTLSKLSDFREVQAVNESPAADQFHGHIHEAVLALLQDPTQPLFHVGGSPAMAWAVFDALVAAGVPAENIHSDVFDYAPRT